MTHSVVVYDACVLYPAPLRDLLLHLALTDLFRARWTNLIHGEWMRSVRASRPDLSPEKLARTRALMDTAVPDCLVSGFEKVTDQVSLPDPNDRHVLAAAIRCQADVIVTYNLKDFPAEHLLPYGIEAQHPDQFICHLCGLSPAAVAAAVRDQRQSLTKPPKTVNELLDTFLSQGLPSTVAALESMRELL